MKRFLPVLLFLFLTLFLAACRPNEKINFLSYQAYPFSARGLLTFDNAEYEVLVTVPRAGDLRLQLAAPKLLKGTVLTLEDETVTVSVGDLTQTVRDGGYAASDGILLAARMFSLTGNNFSDAGVTTEDNVRYSYAEYQVEGGSVRVFIREGCSAPEKLTATLNGHDFSFLFMNES